MNDSHVKTTKNCSFKSRNALLGKNNTGTSENQKRSEV